MKKLIIILLLTVLTFQVKSQNIEVIKGYKVVTITKDKNVSTIDTININPEYSCYMQLCKELFADKFRNNDLFIFDLYVKEKKIIAYYDNVLKYSEVYDKLTTKQKKVYNDFVNKVNSFE